jgi:hypothetical protein
MARSGALSFRFYDYGMMVAQWSAICSRPLTPVEKSSQCLIILRDVVGRLALNSSRSRNPTLRFYAYMITLRADLRPGPGSSDELGKCAIVPAFNLVNEWLMSHTIAQPSLTSFCSDPRPAAEPRGPTAPL